MYKISIFLFIIILMSCGITTKITYTDDLYYSNPRSYNYSPYMYNPHYFNPYNRQYIYIIPRQNLIEPKKIIQQPRQYNLNNIQPKQNSAPIRTFPKIKN